MLKRIKRSRFLKDNLVLLIGSLFGYALTYFYHFYIGRVLGPEKYGIMGALISIITILGILIYTIQTTVTKFVGRLKHKKEYQKLAYIINKLLYDLFFFGIIGSATLFLFAESISTYLKIDDILYMQVTSIAFILISILPLFRGTFQGLQKFKQLGWNYIFEGIAKICAAILLIELGFGVIGAIIAILLSYFVPILIATPTIKKIISNQKQKFPIKKVYKYSVLVFFGIAGMSIFYSIDLILVKHFLSDFEAGSYTAISNLGKIIYFASISIGTVLFPKVLEVAKDRNKRQGILLKSLGIVLIISLPIVAIYYLFPKLIVSLMYGPKYLSIISEIGKFGVFMALFSMSQILVYYHLARKNYAAIIFLLMFVLLETLLIYSYHQSISQIINILIFTISSLFIFLSSLVLLEKRGDVTQIKP